MDKTETCASYNACECLIDLGIEEQPISVFSSEYSDEPSFVCQPEPSAPVPAPVEPKAVNGLSEVFAGEQNASAETQPADVTGKEKEEKLLKEKISGDATGLGIQRLVEVKDSKITVSANYNTRYFYKSNPQSVKHIDRLSPATRDIMVWENGLSVNVGLGQLAVFDRVVTPSLMGMNLRLWTDPHKQYSDEFHSSDIDVQLASLSFSMELPEGLNLNLGYSQSRVMSVRDEIAVVYTESPSLALSKTMIVRDNPLIVNLGTAYNFTDVVALPLPAILEQALGVHIPADGTNAWATNFSMNYMMPVKGIDKLTISPTFGISHTYYTDEKTNPPPLPEGRQDWAFNYGLNASYQLTESVSIQAFGMFTKKTLNSYAKDTLGLGGTEYKNFDAGLGLSASFQF